MARFSNWVVNKYSDCGVNPNGDPIAGDELVPLIAYELAHTDIGPEDAAAIMHLFDKSQGEASYNATTIFSGLQFYLNRMNALKQQFPLEDHNQLVQRIRNEHRELLATDNPVKRIKEEGLQFNPSDEIDISEYYTPQKINYFAQTHQETVTTHFIVLNTKYASPDNIDYLLRLQSKIFHQIGYLESNPKNLPERIQKERLEHANQLLQILQMGGPFKEVRSDVSTELIALNTDEESPDDLKNLSELKDHIIQYIDFLEDHPPKTSKQSYYRRLMAAYNMLEILQEGGTIRNQIIPNIKIQVAIIAINKPGILELGFIAWLQSFFNKYRPQMSQQTSDALSNIAATLNKEEKTLLESETMPESTQEVAPDPVESTIEIPTLEMPNPLN